MRLVKETINGDYDSSADRSINITDRRTDIYQGRNYFKALWNTIFIDGDDLMGSLQVDASSGWDFNGSTYRLMSNGKRLASIMFKEGNINKFAQELYNIAQREIKYNKHYTGIDDYKNWIRSIVDIRQLGA